MPSMDSETYRVLKPVDCKYLISSVTSLNTHVKNIQTMRSFGFEIFGGESRTISVEGDDQYFNVVFEKVG